jgi:hypothetical protein
VAVTRNENDYSLYNYGVQVAAQTNALEIPSPGFDLTIGSSEIFFLDGLIDELEIFERAFTAAEIKSIYDAGSIIFQNLIKYYYDLQNSSDVEI